MPEPHLVCVLEHFLKHLRFKVHLTAVGDMARLADRVEDWDRVVALANRSRLRRGLFSLLAALRRDVRAPIPQGVVGGTLGEPLVDRLAPKNLMGRVRPAEGRMAGLVDRWRMLDGPGAVLKDIAEAAFPPSAWLDARYGRRGPAGWLQYVRDVYRWSGYAGRSPASPNQELFAPTARD